MLRRLMIWAWVAACFGCVLALGMELRSWVRSDKVSWTWSYDAAAAKGPTASGVYVISDSGLLLIGVETYTVLDRSQTQSGFARLGTMKRGVTIQSTAHPAIWFDGHGFWADEYVDWQAGYINRECFVRFPWWVVNLAMAIIVTPGFVLIWRERRRRWRIGRGLCVECGYDLRASPQRCPECGWERSQGAALIGAQKK